MGSLAIGEYHKIEGVVNSLSEKLKTNRKLLEDKINKIIDDKVKLEKKFRTNQKSEQSIDIDLQDTKSNGINIKSAILKGISAKELKNYIDKALKDINNIIVILLSTFEDKVTLVIGVSNDLNGKYNAVDLVRASTPLLGGKGGGGKSNLAQGGGSNPAKSEEVINFLIKKIN